MYHDSKHSATYPRRMSGLGAPAQYEQAQPTGPQSGSSYKPHVVGLFGLPGSGKTYLLKQLEGQLEPTWFAFYEGSTVLSKLVVGGIDAFKKLDEEKKAHIRGLAIEKIRAECAESNKLGVVTGHFMFWEDEGKDAPGHVLTRKDLDTFTHIFYLDVHENIIAERRRNDTGRGREAKSLQHLGKWQRTEIKDLKALCSKHGISFEVLPPNQVPQLSSSLQRIRLFRYLTEQDNTAKAKECLDEALSLESSKVENVLMFDADKTLAPQDSGELFWNMVSPQPELGSKHNALKELFRSALDYTYANFRQATLLYEDAVPMGELDAFCEQVAAEISMYPEIVSLLQLVAEQKHVVAVVVTSGMRLVWEKVLEKEGLFESVKVVGGGRIADGIVVTPEVKEALVRHLKDKQRYVLAFGDSPVDLKMLREAHGAVVVVGREETRSTTMETALENLKRDRGLRNFHQVRLPNDVRPRLDTASLPEISLTGKNFVDRILQANGRRREPRILHATESHAVKILATQTRDATNSGPALQQAHNRVGWYLAHQYVADEIGIEQCPIRHVLGHQDIGFRLFHEDKTTIVAVMRAGEPMARGIHDAFPKASFLHAKAPEDITGKRLQGQLAVILVDSVINNGKTMVDFVRHVRDLHATIRIVLVTGVVQAQAVEGGDLYQELATQSKLSLVALRLSKTKFTGKGGTDTGNRLFNTTHLD